MKIGHKLLPLSNCEMIGCGHSAGFLVQRAGKIRCKLSTISVLFGNICALVALLSTNVITRVAVNFNPFFMKLDKKKKNEAPRHMASYVLLHCLVTISLQQFRDA